MGSRDVIIKGVEELKRVCKLVPAVGRKTNWHTPDM